MKLPGPFWRYLPWNLSRRKQKPKPVPKMGVGPKVVCKYLDESTGRNRRIAFPAHLVELVRESVKRCYEAGMPIDDSPGGYIHRWVMKHCRYRQEQERIIVGLIAMELRERREKWASLRTLD